MMKNVFSFFCLLFAVVSFSVADGAYGNDAPHDGTSIMSMGCEICHSSSTAAFTADWILQPAVGDNTLFNNVCLACHHVGNLSITDMKYKDIKTHSSTSSQYGSWMIECRVCHNAHVQSQAAVYPTEGSIANGIVLGFTYTGITVDNALPAGAYAKYLVAPNMTAPDVYYRIKNNTVNTIMSEAQFDMWDMGIGTSYAIKYGKMIYQQIQTPQGMAPVKFFNSTGPNSFAASNTVVNGICQVCHSRTASFRRDGTLDGPGHPVGTAGTNCMQCHPHSNGFLPVQ